MKLAEAVAELNPLDDLRQTVLAIEFASFFLRRHHQLERHGEPGLVLSFADAKQQELPGVVSKVEGEWVTIDFNHPLAGRTLVFDVEIIVVMAEGAST